MSAFIVKQPNGKYMRFSTVVDCPTHWNMTEQDYIEFCKERAVKEAKDVLKNYIKPFGLVKDCFVPNIMAEEEFNKILKEVEK